MKTPCTLLLGSCLASTALGQWTSAGYSVRHEPTNQPIIDSGNRSLQSQTAQPLSFADSIAGKASASGYVRPGILAASVFTSAQATSVADVGVSELSHASSRVSYFDFMTLLPPSPDLLGKQGTLHASWRLTGSMPWSITGGGNVEHGANTQVYLDVRGDGMPSIITGREIHGYWGNLASQRTDVSEPPPGMIPITLSFTWGLRFGVQYQISLWAQSNVGFGFRDGWYGPVGRDLASSVAGDYGNTMTWSGIQSISDANGNPVTGYTVTSASGFDYAHAAVVPEPPTTMLASGAILAGWMLLRVARGRRPQGGKAGQDR